jgi:TPR repeat protein
MLFPKHVVFPAIATVGIAACFIPVNKSPEVGSIFGIQVARGIAIGLFALVGAFTCLGRWLRDPPWPKRRIISIAPGIIVAVAVYRVIALSSHRMPTFDDDDPRAVPYYQKVCDQGGMSACTLLGTCYWTGACCVSKDQPRAVELFQKACEGSEFGACGQLGVCYEIGACGLPKNSGRAVALYEKACVGGEMSMCNNLGVCYFKGQCGLSRDDARAAELYRRACQGGDSGACHNLEIMGR